MKKIILFELNEVPFRILDNYVSSRPHSFLAKFLSKSRQYETFTEDNIALDPWISWPTFHRGVNDEQHGILHLGQVADQEIDDRFPPIWKRLRKAGASVGVFGSLNTAITQESLRDYAFYLPDYFAGDASAYPETLLNFHRFNLELTRKSARNVSRGIPWKGSFGFLDATIRGGLRADTVFELSSQIVSEVMNKQNRIRRRAMQPLIMCDLFLKQLAETRPDFSTFYTNHVAAAMHRYWAALLPGDYKAGELDSEWVSSYNEEIPFAMEKLELMLRKIVRFTEQNPEFSLVVASSMGQAAIAYQKTYEFLTITDVKKFMAVVGVPEASFELTPAMVPCISLQLKNLDVVDLRRRLEDVKIGTEAMVFSKRPDKRACFELREGYLHLFVQFDNYDGPLTMSYRGVEKSFHEAGLSMMAHEDGVNCTAQHIPQGSLLIYSPDSPDASRTSISTADFVPSVLRNFEMPKARELSGTASIRF
ncbi:hypothetical protein [Terriglobus saanensis]|uniref:Type I phosphodiesterase/nucleotide pyrophosphatase n=1 Tax=Terriglobus saanensis (strain ATCC BAA-1853 / DSM 23119 / SP1PR4) TaxID=401053 RepID=E8V3S7_TERSS|nr:hypothetical protein [Terriglobus saanensis]ADV84764.1 hypothetical protein AciPR4_4015 [Terriglobus saanensis SP1PR4]